MAYKIFLSPPYMGGKEQEFVKDAFDTNWIAPYGPHINAFENEMGEYVGVEAALALTSGTAAIHMLLRWFGVGEGDYVFCQDFTFIGSCDAILYEKATPVFIDSEENTWNMCPVALENAFRWAEKQNKLPKAVIICDLYGESADWDALLPICRRYGVPVIEDAAEAVGTSYKGRRCGSFGDGGAFSFNGNKIITTSGGGMVLSNNKMAVEKMRFWSTQAREPVIWYEHKEYGYNYRMSNVCAAIGRGQMWILPRKQELRRKIHREYAEALQGLPVHIKCAAEKGSSNYWLNVLVIDTPDVTPERIVTALQNAQIESRPAWKHMHMQPIFRDVPFIDAQSVYEKGADCKSCVDESIFRRAVCLPSGDALTREQIDLIVSEIRGCFAEKCAEADNTMEAI